MRRLECGCEILQDTGQFISLCESHGNNLHARMEANKHPRHAIPSVDKAFERELVKVIAPVVIAKWSTPTDPNSTAEAIFAHIREITRRLE